MGLSDLKPKQQAFVKEYVKHKNGTQAVLNSYDTTDSNTAGVMAHDLLRTPKVKRTIDEHLELAGYNPTESIKRLNTTASDGLKSRATRSDATNADKLLLQLSGAIVEKKQVSSINLNVESMDKSDLLKLKAKYDKMLNPSQKSTRTPQPQKQKSPLTFAYYFLRHYPIVIHS
jgi:phage terminase small subunit